MEIIHRSGNSEETSDALLVLGGLALILLGAGVILSSPAARKYIDDLDIGRLLKRVAPELARNLKAM